jgi:putative spermidine/putrescine transport system substrate-binding protein
VGGAVPEAVGLPGASEVRGLLRRDGDVDALGRRGPVRHGLGLGGREPSPDLRRRRAAGRPEQDPRLQELKSQFDATIALLKLQKPLIKKYWALASDEIDLFKNGDAVIGPSWPYQTNTLLAAKAPVKDLIPKEGATGWLDTWMVSAKTKNLDCAYKWLAYISTPKVQAEQAIYFGETPVNSKACAWMDKLSKGSCAQYHANAPLAYFKQIHFWKTPISDCGNGQSDCMPYTTWQQAWTQLKG